MSASLRFETCLPTRCQVRTPVEPMPPPIKEPPSPMENPDAPVREPDPEEPESRSDFLRIRGAGGIDSPSPCLCKRSRDKGRAPSVLRLFSSAWRGLAGLQALHLRCVALLQLLSLLLVALLDLLFLGFAGLLAG